MKRRIFLKFDTMAASSSNGFVFKDVEESLEKFYGESGKIVTAWLKEFEEIAAVCG